MKTYIEERFHSLHLKSKIYLKLFFWTLIFIWCFGICLSVYFYFCFYCLYAIVLCKRICSIFLRCLWSISGALIALKKSKINDTEQRAREWYFTIGAQQD